MLTRSEPNLWIMDPALVLEKKRILEPSNDSSIFAWIFASDKFAEQA